MELWIALHEHKQRTDAYPFFGTRRPTEKRVKRHIEAHNEGIEHCWDGDDPTDWLDIDDAYDVPKD